MYVVSNESHFKYVSAPYVMYTTIKIEILPPSSTHYPPMGLRMFIKISSRSMLLCSNTKMFTIFTPNFTSWVKLRTFWCSMPTSVLLIMLWTKYIIAVIITFRGIRPLLKTTPMPSCVKSTGLIINQVRPSVVLFRCALSLYTIYTNTGVAKEH